MSANQVRTVRGFFHVCSVQTTVYTCTVDSVQTTVYNSTVEQPPALNNWEQVFSLHSTKMEEKKKKEKEMKNIGYKLSVTFGTEREMKTSVTSFLWPSAQKEKQNKKKYKIMIWLAILFFFLENIS